MEKIGEAVKVGGVGERGSRGEIYTEVIAGYP